MKVSSLIAIGLFAGSAIVPEAMQPQTDRPQPELAEPQEPGGRREEELEEEEDERGEFDLEGLDERLEEAEREKRLLDRRLDIQTRRVRLLREMRDAAGSLRGIFEEIEEAEERGEEPDEEELEDRIGKLEYRMERSGARLMLLEGRERLVELRTEVEAADQHRFRAHLDGLEGQLDRTERQMEKLFRLFAEGAEEEAEKLSEELEEAREDFDRRAEILQLKIELFHARREEDFDHIEELEEELGELGVEPEKAKPAKPRKRADQEKAAAMLPGKVEVSDAEVLTASSLDLDQHIAPLLHKACFDCHDADSASGDLDIVSLLKQRPLIVNRRHWDNIIQQLKVRSMPPADAEQPTEADRRTMVAWLTNAIEKFDYSTVHSPGYEPARRLTHAEYNNTVRDLTGIDIRPADRFPDDLTASSGFENSANSLFVQPGLLERYLGAAERVVDTAWPEVARTVAQEEAWKKMTGGVELNSDTADQVLRRFVSHAFRRPASEAEVRRLTGEFDEKRQAGASAEAAMRSVLKIVLVSPSFLLRMETDHVTDGSWQVSDYELASRLSYFLWASMPDARLMQLANSGKLGERDVLRREVTRMLADSRSETLGTIFASQWLGFCDLHRVRRDQIDNPWATDSLVEAMGRESAMLFNSIVSENAPVDRLVSADYTFLNEELARHYRIRGVIGQEMRRVSLTQTPRRGVLGHGSILAITSFPGRTSPVVRGNWVLSRLLGTPPPQPPPNASEFDERIRESRRLTRRQKLEKHRTNPNCYACHSQIDPLGFALEEFEWFGRHRRGHGIDSAGQLPGGKPFNGLRGLSETLLAERIDDLTTNIARKMLSYALGRQLDYYDEATVQQLASKLQENDRRLPSLIHAITQSDAFRMKQKPAPAVARKTTNRRP